MVGRRTAHWTHACRVVGATLALALAGCASASDDQPVSPSPTVNPTPDNEVPVALPVCKTLACLTEHDAAKVWVEGSWQAPAGRHRLAPSLLLADGASAVVRIPAGGPPAPDDGRAVRILGRIFTDKIPESYGVIARTTDPYLLDVEAIVPH